MQAELEITAAYEAKDCTFGPGYWQIALAIAGRLPTLTQLPKRQRMAFEAALTKLAVVLVFITREPERYQKNKPKVDGDLAAAGRVVKTYADRVEFLEQQKAVVANG